MADGQLKAWLNKDGKLLVNGSGDVYICGHCPCEGGGNVVFMMFSGATSITFSTNPKYYMDGFNIPQIVSGRWALTGVSHSGTNMVLTYKLLVGSDALIIAHRYKAGFIKGGQLVNNNIGSLKLPSYWFDSTNCLEDYVDTLLGVF